MVKDQEVHLRKWNSACWIMAADTSTQCDDLHAVCQALLERSHIADKTRRGLLQKSFWTVVVVVVQSLVVFNSVTPRTAAYQAPLSSGSSGVYSNACPLSQWCYPTISWICELIFHENCGGESLFYSVIKTVKCLQTRKRSDKIYPIEYCECWDKRCILESEAVCRLFENFSSML